MKDRLAGRLLQIQVLLFVGMAAVAHARPLAWPWYRVLLRRCSWRC